MEEGLNEVTRLIKGEDAEEPDCWKQIDEYCSLTWEYRIYGFGLMFTLACLLSVYSSFLLGNITEFAIVYSIGALCSLTATMFLMGPCNQLQKMFQPTRIVATCIYLASIVATIVAAFLSGSTVLVLCCIVLQFLALMWYALSFIPYGREAITGCCRGVVSS